MTLQQKLDKHYKKLVNQNKKEEKRQKIKMKIEINSVLFWNKVKKALFGL